MSQLTSSPINWRSRFGVLARTIRRWPLGVHLLLAVNLPLALLLLVLMDFEYRDEMNQAILEKETGLADEAVAVHQAVDHLAHGHSVSSMKQFIERVCAKMQATRSPGHAILVVRDKQLLHSSEHGHMAVDAPVSGGIAAANAGTLTFMVGGSDEAFARSEPILAEMGKAVIHAGDSGAGQAAKICNNMLLGATMVATCEAFALADRLGLDAQRFYDIASVSSGQSWSMTSYCPVPGVGLETPADRDYRGGFAAALMLKDLRLAMEAAEANGANTPMGARARELYEAFVAGDADGLDFSAIIRTL